ncbi:MAG: D-glycero-alpha-D-manno-heptose-1,7-bisphosphate 7-phosphatase [Terriglobia bacterium]
MKARFILLDRDGVINRKIPNGYVTTWNEFSFLPGALEALRLLTEGGYRLVVVSNQAGVGKGQVALSALNQITARFVKKVEACGGRIHRVYYCTHRKDARCPCRKPRPGLLLKAQQENKFEFASAFLIGDSVSDLLAADRVGCPMIMVNGNPASLLKGRVSSPQAIVPDLRSAVDFILSRKGAADHQSPPGVAC